MAEAGLLPRCDPEENNFRIKDYFTDLESYFVALNIANEGKKRSFLQLSLNKETKATLTDLFYPDEFCDQTYQAVKEKLISHYADKKLILVYREKFNQRVQQEGESCKKYFENLRELARMCEYSVDFYKQQMYDRSIVGLTNEMWKANLSMKDRSKHTYQEIQTLAIQYEEHKLTAEKLRPGNSTGSNSTSTTVASVSTYGAHGHSAQMQGKNYSKKNYSKKSVHSNQQSKLCYRCQKGNHNPNNCWHKSSKCEKCGKIGHLTKAHKDSWHKNNSYGHNNVKHTKQDYASKNKSKKVYHVQENYDISSEDSSDTPGEIAFCHGVKALSSDQCVEKPVSSKVRKTDIISKRHGSKITKYVKYCSKSKNVSKPYYKPVHNKPYFMEVKCENEHFDFEIDSGSGITLMPYKIYKEKLNHITLNSTKLKAVTLKGTMNVIGQIQVKAEYKGNIFPSTIYIYDDEAEHLIAGRPWLEAFKHPAPWLFQQKRSKGQVHHISGENIQSCIKKLKKKYCKVFDGKPGTLKDIKVHVEVSESCPKTTSKPKRPLLYNLQGRTDKEIDKWLEYDYMEPVSYHNHAAPIVVKEEDEDNVIICGDFSVTINPYLVEDQYPLPVIQDLFATL